MKYKDIICPFCQATQSDDHMYKQDEDMYALAIKQIATEMNCEICKKEFWVMGSYIPQYETFKTEEDLDEN
jgi:hypothetical protein